MAVVVGSVAVQRMMGAARSKRGENEVAAGGVLMVRLLLLGQGRGWGGHGEDSELRGQQGRWGELGHPLVVGIEEID